MTTSPTLLENPSTDPGSEQDSRLQQFLGKFSPEMAASFSPEQREAIATILTPNPRPRQRLDLRKSFVLLGRQYYFVILFGKDRRTHRRAASPTYKIKTGASDDCYLLALLAAY